MARPVVPNISGSDVWGDVINDAIFDVSDRVDQRIPMDGTSKMAPSYLPAGSVLYSTSTTRPTARTDVLVMFVTATDPGSNAFDNDIWVVTA